ncbi:MAG: glycoside hydrolase family 31 protein [Polyangiaceae bacterium]
MSIVIAEKPARTLHRPLGLAISLASALAPGCVDEVAISPVPIVHTLERGPYTVSVTLPSGDVELSRDGDVLASIAASDFAVGVVDHVEDSVSYDPWPLVADVDGYQPPAGVAFSPARRASSVESVGDSLVVHLEHDGDVTSQLTIAPESDGSFRLELVPDQPERVAWLRVGAAAPDGEAYYGMGELFDRVEVRGSLRAMQLEVADLEGANNEAHAPIPLLIGTRGWGLFVESSYPGVFDIASTDPARLSATYGVGAAASAGLVVHLFGAESPLDVTQRYYQITGAPRLPAPWALGPLVWRDENDDQAQVEADLETMRNLDLPASAIWVDRPYATAVQTFDFDAARFPDAAGMIRRAHDLGYRVSLWHAPYLDEESAATADLRAQAEAGDYYPIETGITLNGWGRPIDFTEPSAQAFWRALVKRYTDMGIEGFKLDYGEDIVPGIFGARNVYRFHDGSDERTMHRGYTLLYHETYATLLPETGGFLLCRAAKYGDQKNGPIVWPGDLDARLWRHGELVTEGDKTFKAVGGLEASIVAGLSLGPSGFAFYGSDTGGYRHAPPSVETFTRWFEQTAFSSVMQIGTGSNDVAWELFADDQAGLDLYRKYTRWHLRLFPYLWTFAEAVPTTGRPIQRPLGLAYPEVGRHDTIEYLLGDALLVAPVTDAGVTELNVVFPNGRYVDLWTGASFDGPAEHTVDATELPVFLRAGELVPMLRPTIDTLAPTTEPALVDSFATDPGPLSIFTTPGDGKTARDVYDGTHLEAEWLANVATLTITPGTVFDRGAMLEIIAFGDTPPSAVDLGSITLTEAPDLAALDATGEGYAFVTGDRGGTLYVKLPAGAEASTLKIWR